MSGAVVVIASESGPAKRTLAEKTRPARARRLASRVLFAGWRILADGTHFGGRRMERNGDSFSRGCRSSGESIGRSKEELGDGERADGP